MLFKKLNLIYFGRFQDREIELKPGINLIYGDNEAGKSTIHTFVKGMLFGIERARGRGAATKEDIYTRYLPWDYPGAYKGSMDIGVGEKEYRLQRSFHASDKSFTVVELSSGREVKLKEGMIREIIPVLTETAFRNTISIGQLRAQTDAELAEQVRNYIANLSIAKSKEVNVTKAVSLLTEQRKQLEASQNQAPIKALQEELEAGFDREEKIDRLTIQRKELLIKEQQLKRQKKEAEDLMDNEEASRIEQFPAIMEKFRIYGDQSKQVDALELQRKELQERIEAGEKEQLSADTLKADIRTAAQLKQKLTEQEKLEQELLKEMQNNQNTGRIRFLISCMSVCIAALLGAFLTGFRPVGLFLMAMLLFAGIVLSVLRRRRAGKKQQEYKVKLKELQQQSEKARTETEEILARNQVSSADALASKQEELQRSFYTLENMRQQFKDLVQRRRNMEDSKDVLYEAIMKYMQYFIREEELSNTAIQRLTEEIRQRRQSTQGRLSQINGELESLRLQSEKLQWEISTMEGNEEQLLRNKERLEELMQTQQENAVELEAVRLALSTIQELSADIHDSFGQQLNEAVSGVIGEVTGHRYHDLKVNEKLEVKVGWNGAYIPLDRLSAGTIDQVYFALRLAVADLLLGKDEVPLLLDDSFALYDETRVEAALRRISQRKQTLLFTCHKREQDLLEEMRLPYHFVDLSSR